MTRPDREMACVGNDDNPFPHRKPQDRPWVVRAIIALGMFGLALILISCAVVRHEPPSVGLVEITDFHLVADGDAMPDQSAVPLIAGPGCFVERREEGRFIVCPKAGGRAFVAEIVNGRVVATWIERKV